MVAGTPGQSGAPAAMAAVRRARVGPDMTLLEGCRWGRAGVEHGGLGTGPRMPGERHNLTVGPGVRTPQ
ncbi:hypothetical protein GCM10020256_13260 [Streptomyces thermocoprophilus]